MIKFNYALEEGNVKIMNFKAFEYLDSTCHLSFQYKFLRKLCCGYSYSFRPVSTIYGRLPKD